MKTTKRPPTSKAAKKRASTPSSSPAVPPPPPPPPVPEKVEESLRPCIEFQYAVKLVQGAAPNLTNASVIAPGTYFTAINVHNPSTCKLVKFRWKVAVADKGGKHVSEISSFRNASLRPDEALEIDAVDIARTAGVPVNLFIKGFVVIESPCELDVVAVYTVLPAAQPTVVAGTVAFHTERVPARKIEACVDLKLDISTGAVPWTITSIPPLATNFPTPIYQAIILQNANRLQIPLWATQPGALWVSARALVNSGPAYKDGWYVFQYCFTLCSGFTGPALNLSVLVDDRGWIRLNGNWISPYIFSSPHVPPNLSGPPRTIAITSGFLPGRNCLEVLVYNDFNSHPSNPVGLNLQGTMTAERGACREGCGCCS
jgi:hypothetical protein